MEERQPSRRRPVHFRVDLRALAEVLGLIESSAKGETPQSPAVGEKTEPPAKSESAEPPTVAEPLQRVRPETTPHRGAGETTTPTTISRAPLAYARGARERGAYSVAAQVSPETSQKDPQAVEEATSAAPTTLSQRERASTYSMLDNAGTEAGDLLRHYVAERQIDGQPVELRQVAEATARALTGDAAAAQLYEKAVRDFVGTFAEDLRQEVESGVT
jgi:hypothetical protein